MNFSAETKLRYHTCLEKGQMEGDLRPFLEFIMELLRSSNPGF
jgi:hypothetical protein